MSYQGPKAQSNQPSYLRTAVQGIGAVVAMGTPTIASADLVDSLAASAPRGQSPQRIETVDINPRQVVNARLFANDSDLEDATRIALVTGGKQLDPFGWNEIEPGQYADFYRKFSAAGVVGRKVGVWDHTKPGEEDPNPTYVFQIPIEGTKGRTRTLYTVAGEKNVAISLFEDTVLQSDAAGEEGTPGDGGPSGGNGSCFPAGTKITMEDGSLKNIEEVKVGEMVLAFDESDKDVKPGHVSSVIAPMREGVFSINGGMLRLTDDHPIFVQKADGTQGWASFNPDKTLGHTPELGTVLKIEKGDFAYNFNVQGSGNLLSVTKQWVEISSVEYREGEIQVYHLTTVDKYHTFFANGILVHNKGSGGCFKSGSQITMADNTTKAIEEIQETDMVLGLDLKDNQWKPFAVTEIQNFENATDLWQVNDTLNVSSVHRLSVNDAWKTAPQIQVGDRLSNKNRSKVVVKSIRQLQQAANKHNIVLGKNKNVLYLVDGLLVYNGW